MLVTFPGCLPCPYMVKRFRIFFQATTGPILMKLCKKHQRPKPFIVCPNYDPGLTLTYFTTRVKFCHLGFHMGKCNNDGFFGKYVAISSERFPVPLGTKDTTWACHKIIVKILYNLTLNNTIHDTTMGSGRRN